MPVGTHIIADLYGCRKRVILDEELLRKIFEQAVDYSGLRKIHSHYHSFTPHGFTGVILLAESHISFHTWPEHGFLSLDIFGCSSEDRLKKAFNYIMQNIKHRRAVVKIMYRGERLRSKKKSSPSSDRISNG